MFYCILTHTIFTNLHYSQTSIHSERSSVEQQEAGGCQVSVKSLCREHMQGHAGVGYSGQVSCLRFTIRWRESTITEASLKNWVWRMELNLSVILLLYI